ncbi:MAG: pyridoxamine 5'-phosphate oxidase family protein [Polyangiaceae bacterium]|nr:pyridoxamine 5'-phosphate oxidase family protein [Polyangiaceae bacterium]
MIHPNLDSAPSPWHSGERALQEHYGVAEQMDRVGRRVIRDYMPDQHRTFFGQLPFVLVGAVDNSGAVWASILEGAPGFITSPDPRTLRLRAMLPEGDPVSDRLVAGAAVGLLGIELHTRRRNRMNGKIANSTQFAFDVTVEHSFGNCPQYIHPRHLAFVPDRGAAVQSLRAEGLTNEGRAMIAVADTFFVASYVDADGDVARRSVDVSHRGGDAGFVHVSGDVLTIPDFSGNLHFNTLGNLIANPRAGLLFVDFERGDILQLTGRTEVILDGPEVEQFEGAERLWRLTVEKSVLRQGAFSRRQQGGPA